MKGGLVAAIWAVGALQRSAIELLLATAGHLESALRIRGSISGPFFNNNRRDRGPVPFVQRFERHLLLARSVLGAELVARAWAEGQAMALPEAIAYAQRAVLPRLANQCLLIEPFFWRDQLPEPVLGDVGLAPGRYTWPGVGLECAALLFQLAGAAAPRGTGTADAGIFVAMPFAQRA